MTDRTKRIETLTVRANAADSIDHDFIGISVDTARAIVADLEALEAMHEYTKGNPLGGPATMFDAIAARIRAGEDYYFVLNDYGLRFNDAETSPDAERLDLLEHLANQPGGLLLHDGSETGRLGLGLRPGMLRRTLREAIDTIHEDPRIKTLPRTPPRNPPARTPDDAPL